MILIVVSLLHCSSLLLFAYMYLSEPVIAADTGIYDHRLSITVCYYFIKTVSNDIFKLS